jgi:hypothetical protein
MPTIVGWFEGTFWPAWPVKENKAAAEKASKDIAEADREAVMTGLRIQADRIRSMERPIHAATWIHNRRWEDEERVTPLFPPANHAETATERAIRVGLERVERTGRL